jgi:hypothetical protein
MAYKTARCICPSAGNLQLVDHLPACPDYVSEAELQRELDQFRQDAAMLRALAPSPPQELSVFICLVCGKPYLKLTQLRRCHFSGTWVQEGQHYVTWRYALVPD